MQTLKVLMLSGAIIIAGISAPIIFALCIGEFSFKVAHKSPSVELAKHAAKKHYVVQAKDDAKDFHADPVKGEALFAMNCAACHQVGGEGKIGLAPSIRNRDFLAIASDKFIYRTVIMGRPGTAMVPRADLAGEPLRHIISYLRALPIAVPIDVTVNDKLKSTGDAEQGKHKYAVYCASCHGPNGEGYAASGSGPGIGLEGFLKEASDDFIFQTVKQGRVGTAMRSFIGSRGLANLAESDVHDIIVHLRQNKASLTPAVPATTSGKLAGNAAEGEKIYNTNCMPCHQPGGLGKVGLAPSIRNRDFLAIASDEFIKATVQQGRPGTAMVPRPDLNGQALTHVIAYLRALPIANPVKIEVDPHRKYEGDPKVGAIKYATYCASCHGPKGEGYVSGGSGPGIGLPGFLNVAHDDFIFQTVKQGRMGTAMMPFMGPRGLANLNEQDVGDIIQHLRNPNK